MRCKALSGSSTILGIDSIESLLALVHGRLEERLLSAIDFVGLLAIGTGASSTWVWLDARCGRFGRIVGGRTDVREIVFPLLGIDLRIVGQPKVFAESIIVDRLPVLDPALGAVVVIFGSPLVPATPAPTPSSIVSSMGAFLSIL